ncbi:phosphotransferase family protein [Shimazuella alba]|uniref:Phosphotransferase n=1 Tax=Shimazuella alba TaxID=2690964 RepID=A0A6I4VPX5_9BACL|nr:aminoglycoside phosphotransferase family protein [Shimazuella alba]MXQ52431.1 phosphotransferase [Shimazuella alba]
MHKMLKYIECISHLYPDLILSKIEPISTGQNNDILLINSNLIFRFPKYRSGIKQLKIEVEKLDMIRERVSLSIPNPIYRNMHQNKAECVFMGYPKIEGEPLTDRIFNEIDKINIYWELAKQLTDFLKELHSIPVDVENNQEMGKMIYTEWSDLYKQIKEKLFPYMSKKGIYRTEEHFKEFLGNKAHFDIHPVWIHGDFGTSNILYNSKRQRLSGIIDFSSFDLGDPAVDYAALLASYGNHFFHILQDVEPDVALFVDRVHFYHGTFALQEALFGLENNDPEAFRSGMESFW